MKFNNKFSRRGGFTLIELVVVVAVLAILAGLVLPKLDVFKLKANKATAAANIAGVDRFVESFKCQKDNYPDGWDSLLDNAAPTTLYTKLDPQLTGSIPGSPIKLTVMTTGLTVNQARSLNRVGILNMHHHDATAGFPGNSALTANTAIASGVRLATLNAPADGDAQAIINELYPNGLPSGKTLVVFGLGPLSELCNNTSGNATLHGAPFYANTDQLKYYNRFLALFEVDDNGGRAKFLCALGADADRLNEEVVDFYEN